MHKHAPTAPLNSRHQHQHHPRMATQHQQHQLSRYHDRLPPLVVARPLQVVVVVVVVLLQLAQQLPD
jgi:uncharacterized membrane protein YdfJ with MMPL/SSD domain